MRTWQGTLVAVGAVLAGTALVVACGGDPETSPPTTTSSASSSPATPVEDLVVEEDDLVNINTMTPVRGFFVDNLLGHLDEALAIAEANEGGTYPVGTIIQLVPTEVMVKRAPGFSPETKDWEFLFVEVTAEGTKIIDRGTTDVINAFGLDCASCHLLAEDRFDMVCETDHGCEPLPIGRDVIDAVQAADPRPR
ncbi:MAG TPA: hypothetical protein VF228_05460 [Iamia sp.]